MLSHLDTDPNEQPRSGFSSLKVLYMFPARTLSACVFKSKSHKLINYSSMTRRALLSFSADLAGDTKVNRCIDQIVPKTPVSCSTMFALFRSPSRLFDYTQSNVVDTVVFVCLYEQLLSSLSLEKVYT